MAIEPSSDAIPFGVARTGAQQFDRIFRLALENIVPKQFQTDGNSAQIAVIDTDKIQGLRVRFEFSRPFVWTPCVGKIEVFNLSADTRAHIQDRNAKAVIAAGYRGTGLIGLGVMSVAQVSHRREGPDWITKLEGGDGGRNFWNARANLSFAGGTPMATAVNALVSKLGHKTGPGTIATIQKAFAGKVFKNGASFQGNAHEELRHLLKSAGVDLAIANETVYAIPEDGDIGQVIEIGPESGLIGSPDTSAPPHPGKPKLLKVKILLRPDLLRGQVVSLNTRQQKGIFRIYELKHTGDTHGDDWTTELTLYAAKVAS